MIKETKVFIIECDNCKDIYEMSDDLIFKTSKIDALEDIKQSILWAITKKGKTYCDKCHKLVYNEKIDEYDVYSNEKHNISGVLLGVNDSSDVL